MKTKYNVLLGSASLVCLLAASPALAQQPQSAATQIDTSDAADIVVTANKRQENINKVGLSITAVSGEALQDRKVTSLEDIASVIPGLAFASSTANTPIFTLRGVGFNESSLGVYPAVSVYLDQTPLPFPVMASHTAFDLERVEVLKGPQGTLFGQNSTGGAINYIAAKPTNSFEAGGDISYGRFNQIEGNAFVSGPITPNLRFRLAGTALHSDDWQKSYTRDDKLGEQNYYAGRLLLDWDPTDTIRFALNVNGWRDKSDPQAQQLVLKFGQIPAYASPALLDYPFPRDNARTADWSTGDLRPRADRKFFQAALRSDFDLTDNLTLTSITSYDDYKQNQVTDGDGMNLIIFDLEKNDGYIRSFNQELRLANDQTGTFRWILGANYEKSTTFENQILRYIDSTNYNPNNLYINASGVTNKQKIENYAFFGNAEYKLTEELTLKAAARYTQSRNNVNICGYSPGDGHVADLFNLLGSLLSSVPFTPIGQTDCYTLNETNTPGEPYVRTLKEDNVSWRAGIDYQVTPQTLIYANASRGYKAGSFPSLAAATYAALAPVTQESVTAYEAGVKTQLFDRKVGLNFAAFYYDYRDKQIRGKTTDPIFGILDVLVNVPKSRIQGAEADLTLRPTDGLTITAAGTFLDSKVQRYDGLNVIGATDNFRGDPLPFTPKWSGSLNVDYKVRMPNGGSPFIGFTVTGRSASDATLGGRRITFPASPATILKPGVDYIYKIDGYATVDARVGYVSDGDRWRVSLWGKNIFNEYYWTNVIPANDSSARFAGRPATYGITFGFNFN
jgi:outer membrane receptor protein involved in Fe transport